MGWFTDVRDAVESVAVVAGNFYIPGSSLITSKLASKGAQEHLDSDIGMIAQIGSSIYGFNNSPLFNSPGASASGVTGSPVGGASLNPNAIPGSVDPLAAYTPAANSAAATSGVTSSVASAAPAKAGFADKALAFIDKHPMVAVMGASTAMQGIAAVDAGKQAEKDRQIAQQRHDQQYANINAPTTLGFAPKPYRPPTQPTSVRAQGLLNYTPRITSGGVA